MADKDIQVRTVSERSISTIDERSPSVNGTPGSASTGDHGFGLFKYGRGYWVRVLTAVALGTLFLATALWAANQLEAFNPPVRAWDVAMSSVRGTLPGVGQTVDLSTVENNRPAKIASGVVESVTKQTESSATIRVRDVLLINATDSPTQTRRISIPGATPDAEPAFTATVTDAPAPQFKFQRVYVQGAVAGTILLVGMALIYMFVGNKPRTVDFLIATDEEMRKVNWSTRKIIFDSTMVVIGATFFIATAIFIVDLILKQVLLNQFVGR
jgi:preprotein translocase SecE subunit